MTSKRCITGSLQEPTQHQKHWPPRFCKKLSLHTHEWFLKVYQPVVPDRVFSYWKKNCPKMQHQKNMPSRW